MRIPARLFVEEVTIETQTGQGAYGDAFAAPVTVLGHITGGRRVVNGGPGDDVVTEKQLLLPNPTHRADGSGTVDPTDVLTPESRVTSGSVTGVITRVDEHRKPGADRVVYVSGSIGA